jgi:transglutaminase-like putative cysteine protease
MRFAPLLLLLLASTALAQAPVITPAGDPSVQSDTIYRLAVNPADYPDDPYIYLLDDGVVRFEADGRGTRTYRQVVQILTQQGAEHWGEQVFSYSSAHEKLTINWIRVLAPDGTVISARPTHEQETESPAALASPVYSDVKLHRVTLGGVVPGVLVDYSYTVTTTAPVMPGDFFSSWSVTTGRPTRRSRFIVDVPASLEPRIHERNLGFTRVTTVAHGRRVYEWATAEVPKPPPAEPFASDSNGVVAAVSVSSPEHWSDVARWYAALSRDRYTVTPELDARLASVVAGAAAAMDSLRAVHRWVAQDFRYVSIALGIGGYQPRPPAAVLETKYGDCKDKATLFVALARRMGFAAFPVLLSADGETDSTLPSVGQFDHMIAAVQRPAGYLYLDLTADDVPLGQLPPSEYGAFALLVHPDGRGEEVRLPLDSIADSRAVDRLEGDLSADGHFTGRLVRTRTGRAALSLRDALSRPFGAAERAEIARGMANEIFDGAQGDSLELFDGRDLGAAARLAVSIRAPDVLSSAGPTTSILRLPLRPLVRSGQVADVESHVPRHYPIDVGAVLGLASFEEEYRITLPPGWHARLPAPVTVSGPFGSYTAAYTQDGRLLHIVRSGHGARGTLPPDRVGDLVAFLRTLSQDDAAFILLEHP